MTGYQVNLKQMALVNENFRQVLHTAVGGQLVVMSLQPGEEIGLEVHEEVDQFFWIVQGTAKAILDREENLVGEEEVLVVPRGTNHNLINVGEGSLKLFTVYTPPNHSDGTIHKTKAEAEAAEANR